MSARGRGWEGEVELSQAFETDEFRRERSHRDPRLESPEPLNRRTLLEVVQLNSRRTSISRSTPNAGFGNRRTHSRVASSEFTSILV